MDRDQIAQIPAVAQLLATMPANEQNAVLDLLAATTAAAVGSGGVPTQRTQARRAAGVPQQRFKLWNAYFSIVRFAGVVTAPAANTIVTWQGGTELRPFSYRIGDALTAAGFPALFGPNALATQCDTNLVKASETNAGEQVRVHGISLMPSLTTDSGAWAWLNDNMSVVISMDGDAKRYRLGRPFMIPASGGSYGLATSVVTVQQLGAWSNGVPDIANYYPFPEPMLWTSGGETDSNFNVVLRLERGVTISAPTTAASPLPANSGTDVGSFVDCLCRLHTSQTGARSLNQ
jgi:hypothetical protein